MAGTNRSLRAIFFDVDDTLYSTTEFARRAQHAAVNAMIAAGLRTEFDTAWAELREIIAEFSSNRSTHYQMLLHRLPPEDSAGINPALLVAAGVVAYHETKSQHLQPFPDVLPALARLAQTTLVLGAVTAGLTVKQAEKLHRLGVLPYLRRDAVFITEQAGIGKSNPKLFQRACEAIDVAPTEAMYVGDRPTDDVDSPKAVGMVTVLRLGTGKYAGVVPNTTPDFKIEDLHGLEPVLRDHFGITLPDATPA
jgi:putative hydrolase of the HAD superfamily